MMCPVNPKLGFWSSATGRFWEFRRWPGCATSATEKAVAACGAALRLSSRFQRGSRRQPLSTRGGAQVDAEWRTPDGLQE
jgi:hypothetical protein